MLSKIMKSGENSYNAEISWPVKFRIESSELSEAKVVQSMSQGEFS